MGLDFTHCDAKWGYSGFNRFRTKLAAEIGIALNCMESFAWDFDRGQPYETVEVLGYLGLDQTRRPLIGLQPVIKWDKVKDDIKSLLSHSDCDGELTPGECQMVAPRLRELVKDWPDNDHDKKNALLLADGMEAAIKANESLEFI